MSSNSATSTFEEFVKSPHDKSTYRLVTLPNSLQAILVSEPGLEKVINFMSIVCIDGPF